MSTWGFAAKALHDGAGGRTLRWSSVGHPEPLMLTPDGRVTELTAPIGPPLGIGWRGPRADGTAELPDGATVLLFTDGLFERRGVPLDDGREEVVQLLERFGDRPLDELCDRLLAVLLAEGAEDDVALLALRTRAAAR